MLRVYLDQNKWIDLARAAKGLPSGAPFLDVLRASRAAVAAGTASFPLDMYRYVETGKREDSRSRNDVADMMIELSRRHTMALGRAILPAELDHALNAIYGRPENPRRVEVFGIGIRHMTRNAAALPKLDPERIATSMRMIDPPDYLKNQDVHAQLLEAELLRAGPGLARAAGVDPDSRHIDQQYVDHENMIATEIRAKGLAREYVDLAVRASDLGDIRSAAEEALERIGLNLERLLEDLGPAGVVQFMDALPSRYVTNVMRAAKLRQAEQKWEHNDLNDILALPVAAAYCDVVVTEKQWVHRLTQGKIESRYGTTLLTNLADLTPILEAHHS
ncbi:hypothetical protein [Microbacterium laevaniformans]|uniref:hypothetical protein n=1 Tax=Microbacterium laevaniformans TaxID=36807 RepID=UPI003633ECCC